MTGLTLTALHATHGRSPVLDGIDLTVEDGDLACILGPSGCGKSTLLRVVAGFHPAAAGQVVLHGRVLDDGRRRLPAERRNIGLVPQDGALFPHLTVAANIGFGLPRAQRRERVGELLELVGLGGLGERRPHQLSGGQQQRVALARALAPRPGLLLLDEPFAALDAALRAELRREVAATLRQAGTTAILVTHDQDEALSFADTVAVLRDGRIAQAGTPDTLYHRPADASVARVLGEANLVPAELTGARARTAFGTLPVATTAPTSRRGLALLRPRQLRLTADPAPGAVRARVLGSDFRGHDHRIELRPEGTGLPDTLIAYSELPWGPGEAYVGAAGPVHVVPEAAGSA
ncbi:ABC transporter ATP-binding protein [Streptomyces kaniharaensis]|uniref:ABC-type quaternary amine transporter n=1 Tax=Streptomyces kaniharaensis TaxID=212423 RepID=A0A6N7KLG7_9ACTN|nr:ABC transporter ATP-binding protein [Streptomyces kaniharaensis]MQS11288.1 ABC transporter ATP-binding protein [Streptomyces kaniharaensis]